MINHRFFFFLSLFIIISTSFLACSDSAQIDANDASKIIAKHLVADPEFKTIRFDYGEMKFNSDAEIAKLESYKQLASEGLIKLEQISSKKKFLSKDSAFVYQVKLTDKASDYVLKQGDGKAVVKAVIYEVDKDKEVTFNKVNDNHAKVTIHLKKINTPFAPFQKKQNEFSEFMTKTYRLKFDKNAGWKVTN
ncbi:MAG: hypothetical protein EOO99_03925 [Pedobacter sp.]|nr:MAG: hypothetical protein EOO99_03925 [Pedobacter sp.]